MANTYFEMYQCPEQYNEIQNKYMALTSDELKALNVPKARMFFSVEDIDILQDGLQCLIQTAAELGQGFADERRVMQMGYALEGIKHKIKKRTS